MNLHEYRQRLNYLGLKAKTLGLGVHEQKELDRLLSIRIRETPDGTIFIEPHPMNLEQWKAAVQRSRGTPRTLLADDEHKNTT